MDLGSHLALRDNTLLFSCNADPSAQASMSTGASCWRGISAGQHLCQAALRHRNASQNAHPVLLLHPLTQQHPKFSTIIWCHNSPPSIPGQGPTFAILKAFTGFSVDRLAPQINERGCTRIIRTASCQQT